MPPPTARGPLALVLAAALLAGCTGQSPPEATPVAPTSGAGAPPPAGDATGNATGFAAETEGNRTFAPVEHTFHMDYYGAFNTTAVPVPGAPRNTGNMGEATWDVPVPPGARFASAVANWSALFVGGQMSLMFHNGTAAEPGSPAFAEAMGEAPLALGPVPLEEGLTNLVLMFHVAGDPVALQVQSDAMVTVTFG